MFLRDMNRSTIKGKPKSAKGAVHGGCRRGKLDLPPNCSDQSNIKSEGKKKKSAGRTEAVLELWSASLSHRNTWPTEALAERSPEAS